MEQTSIKIIKLLISHGHKAYWAGGTVRDMLRGETPKDYDIATSAHPEEIEDILEHTIPIGKKFGVILAVENEHHFEIATFRSDSSYTDGRRPDAVYFTDPKDDAKRRDFTINGMFYDPIEKNVLDFVDGQKDLKNKVLRFIGDPQERIKEDNLRLLRAIRFKNRLGLTYADGTFEAIQNNSHLITNVSSERIFEETSKILKHTGRAAAIKEICECGLLKIILPEVEALKNVKQPDKYHKEGDVYAHTLMALDSLQDNVSAELAWSVLLHDIGKPATYSVSDRIRFNNHAHIGSEMVFDIAKRLKFPNNFRDNVSWIVSHHMMIDDILKMKRSRQAQWIHSPLFDELLELHRADALGSIPQDLSLYKKLKEMSKEKELFLPKPDVLLTGDEIMKKFKLSPGPRVGELLEIIHEAQMEEKIKTKSEAINYLKNIL